MKKLKIYTLSSFDTGTIMRKIFNVFVMQSFSNRIFKIPKNKHLLIN